MPKRHHLSEEKRQFILEHVNGATKLREGLYRAISGSYKTRFKCRIRRKVVSDLIEEKAQASAGKNNSTGGVAVRRVACGPTVRRSRGRHPSFHQH